jgi:hypothetical protein
VQSSEQLLKQVGNSCHLDSATHACSRTFA